MEEISIGEALQRMKNEILAQDWRLSQRRIEMLLKAFEAVDREAADRECLSRMLAMARATLNYIKKHGNRILPDVFDFQKESLAHLVNLIEDHDLSHADEEDICKRAFDRFESLKSKLARKAVSERS